MKSWRLTFLVCLVCIGAAIILSRLFYVQVINRKLYQAQALGQQAGFAEVQGDRGEIFSENSKESHGEYGSGQVKSLAIKKENWLAYAVPKNIKDKNNFSETLAKALKKPKEFISAKLEESDTYVILQKDLSPAESESLKKLQLEGLYFEASPARYYPQESLASQVVGFFGGSNAGQYGIEGYYQDILQGEKGIEEKKSGLNLIRPEKNQEPLNGADLFLTIDYNIQFQAEALLQEAYKNIDIESGQVIVIKPDSGRVLALANFPQFDANKYSKETNYDVFQNAAVQKIFEPGSIFKPFIMAMALNEGKVTPESTFTDTGSVTIGPDTIYNFNRQKYGTRDMSGILEKSINTGAVHLSKQISHQTFLDYIDKLGFNYKTGIDLQGEVYSKNDILKKGSDFGFATAAFGQGIEMTPIQLVSAFSVFANGGKMVKPYVVEKVVQGATETKTSSQISDQIISQKTASEVTAMMVNVVDRGFGDAAKIQGYYLAGKTGTAEVPIKDKRGYYTDRTIQSFIGFAPALKPQFLILVKLDNPKVPKSALSAAPIFKKMAQYIINYWQIPPDY